MNLLDETAVVLLDVVEWFDDRFEKRRTLIGPRIRPTSDGMKAPMRSVVCGEAVRDSTA
jgi:hypothetical protein